MNMYQFFIYLSDRSPEHLPLESVHHYLGSYLHDIQELLVMMEMMERTELLEPKDLRDYQESKEKRENKANQVSMTG